MKQYSLPEIDIVLLDSIDSTNSEAMRRVAAGAREGLCLIARKQTAGRGREQRSWHSPPDAGLYLSMVLKPNAPVRFWPMMTMLAAVSVHDSLEGLFSIECDIKWPNDVHSRERKISGILAEIAEGPAGQAAVLGIGINLLKSVGNVPSLNATSIEGETGKIVSQKSVYPDLLSRIWGLYREFQCSDDFAWLLDEWSARSSYVYNRTVKVKLLAEEFTGITRGHELDGALRVETSSGIRVVRSGDVVALRSQDGTVQ